MELYNCKICFFTKIYFCKKCANSFQSDKSLKTIKQTQCNKVNKQLVGVDREYIAWLLFKIFLRLWLLGCLNPPANSSWPAGVDHSWGTFTISSKMTLMLQGIWKKDYGNREALAPVVRKLVSTNPGLNFNHGVFFFLSKALSRIIFSLLYRSSFEYLIMKL